MMRTSLYIFVVGLLAYVQSGSETVWLKEVTKFHTDTRTLSDRDLPNLLTFHLRRRSNVMTLNLKRNYDIDPNTDIYLVQKLKDGRSFLAKTNDLEKEDLAYYQDRDNGAFMTVRCLKKSKNQCERVINGNIQIGDSNFDLRLAENEVTSRNLHDVTVYFGKRYILQDHANIQREHSFKNKGIIRETKVEQELTTLHRRLHRKNSTLSVQNVAATRRGSGKTRQSKNTYYVDVAVVIDPGIWAIYSSLVDVKNHKTKKKRVKREIREAYSHIMNGVNLLYQGIEDMSISITVTLSAFIFFQHPHHFPHKNSSMTFVNGTKYIDAYKYIEDLSNWDEEKGINYEPQYDHAMLFSSYDLYRESIEQNTMSGLAYRSGVCDDGIRLSVIQSVDYVRTVKSATHELGHSLGAFHDGVGDAKDCDSEDLYIMSSAVLAPDPARPYSRNPWLFSNCSVESFKKTLKDKECVMNLGGVFNKTEWSTFTKIEPGERYSPDEQCHHINGIHSVYCGGPINTICQFMTCTNPKTGLCTGKYFGAARGTRCGHKMAKDSSCRIQPCMKIEMLLNFCIR